MALLGAPVITAPQRLADIVVPTHGRPQLLRRLLTALTSQLRSASECGAIIVNDGTHDTAYASVIGEFDECLEYLVLDRNRGPAHARNAGARHSRAEFLIFTDDDCLPPRHWLDWVLARIETLPNTDVIGGTTVPPAAVASPTAVEQFNRALRLYPHPLFSNREMYCLPTANVAVRRSVFLEAGGFDESFRFAAGEDTEFFYRLRMSGARFFIDMQWQTEHPIADGLRSFLRRWYRYGYGNAQHRIRTGDPFENGVPPGLTLLKILRQLPKYVENRRNYVTERLQSQAEPLSAQKWQRAFIPLATAQRFAYQFGGFRAYRAERPGRSRVAAAGSASSERIGASAAPVARSSSRPVPPFGLIIGAMKCGTSALFSSLRRHPSVAPCRLKEPRFFFDDAERAKEIDWYLDLFDYDPALHTIAVEAATRNTMLPLYSGAARRMVETGWQFRFVYLVRDPIERIESHYLHGAVADFGLSPLSAGGDPLPIQFSRYHYQLESYRALFGPESILVIAHEDWKSDPERTLERVCRHFGLDLDRVGKPGIVHSSEYNYRRALLIRELRARGPVPPELSADNVLDVLGALPAGERGLIEAAINARYRLTEAQITEVRCELAEDMRLLRADYGIDVSRWGFAG